MNAVDVNCFLGNWPFRRIRKNNYEDMERLHKDLGIGGGYIASLNSLFYNDPFEGEEELHEIIADTQYHHVLSINPILPCFEDDILKGLDEFNIKAVRIYPGYHGYKLQNDALDQLCLILGKCNLPLFLSMRMEDARLGYLVQPQNIELSEVRSFIERHADIKILLLNIFFHEIVQLKDEINSLANIFIDTSGIKEYVFNIEKLTGIINWRKVMYGSLYPLQCMKSTYLQVEKAMVDREIIEGILSINSNQLSGSLNTDSAG